MGRRNLTEMTMKFLSLLMISAIFAASIDREEANLEELAEGMNPFGELTEDEFLELFDKTKSDDPEEMKKRAKALKKHEKEVLENNEAFLAGNQTWFDEINEYSDLDDDEFESNHTGMITNITASRFATGMFDVPLPYDQESERFFDAYRYSRASVPASYNSVSLGNVSPVKNQKSCGSCVAFATMALVETCFKKTVGTFGDYSEQQFVNCAYDSDLVSGCNGASPHGYAKWLKDKKPKLTHETTVPYVAKKQTCSTYKEYNQGVSTSGAYWTDRGDEETLKKLVAKHGAVGTGVAAAGAFSKYKGGIFSGCSSTARPDHAVAVVGYGTENGVDYWLIKNSWGSSWGEKGYIRVKRGVKMCGIGGTIVTLSCAKGSSSASTSAPVTTTTTAAPATNSADCTDTYTNCPDLAKSHCWDEYVGAECKKSCGLCKGMTPVSSNTCYDEFDNCAELCAWVPGMCKKSCKKC